ncbi:MAG: 2-C-methyl-D-erythritol 4-phosphate cytidylyltransferase [Mycobacteriales bacterium]
MTVGVVVPAAGTGTRLGPGAPKALRDLAGEPLLVHAVRRLRGCPSVGSVVVAAPPAELAQVQALLPDAIVVAGGAERQDSVAAGLAALPAEVDLVLVHDAARALVPVEVVEAVVTALRGGAAAAVPVLAVADTVKQVAVDGRVVRTVPRSDLRCAQTPQGFQRSVLEAAHRSASASATDDAGLVEAAGVPVMTVPGSPLAFKVTTPFDLLVAEAVLRGSAGAEPRG